MGHSTEELEVPNRRATPNSVMPPLLRGGCLRALPLGHHQPAPPATAHELRTILAAAASSGPRQLLARGQE